ncbi:hypothetical protein D3OALGA1CA_4367 [Olavius algarvensis associated proteobacterium Delta 3]|nr:hypothetical protein D3OALGB2SA_179 [Olavius algarvensis associated proteobacterium Delta 3]CAB5149987.1 hypothetical protein D3OALGA1CA_4367 [Olavius algarvensis associated proteobacterium Delta 3]
MLHSIPQEKPWVAWLVVAVWSFSIFLTIPLARRIREFVSEQWGRELFTYAVLATIAVAFTTAVYYVARYRPSASRKRLLWLAASAAIFTAYTIYLGKRSPEEAIHFIQYGVLGILVYRALSIKRHDFTIYISAAVICGIIGTVDEFIQWLIPQRFWDFRDIWINFFAAALVQVAIAKGLEPTYIAGRPSVGNLRFLCRLLAVAAAMIGASLINTPFRVAWYADRIPGLEYLKKNESIMVEYAYRHDDPDIGMFYSRFLPNELQKTDLERGTEAAAILNMYRDRSSYSKFLKIYTSAIDPFLHEARVHLFSRDANFSRAMEIGPNSDGYAWALTKAFRENQIMEKYFPNTLHASAYVWNADQLAFAERHLRHDKVFKSWVSRHLITSFTDAQAASVFVLLVLGLVLLNQLLKKYESPSQ